MHLMNRNAFVSGAFLLLALVLAGPASARHCVPSSVRYPQNFYGLRNGSEGEIINPHSYLTINVTGADGKVQKWAFELGGPGALRRAGMSREDRGGLKPGDEVTASGLGAKDGSTTGFLQELKLADGRVFKFAADPNGN